MGCELDLCKYCKSSDLVRYGTQSERSCFHCKTCNTLCKIDYFYPAYETVFKERFLDMALNRTRISDTSRVLSIGKSTVNSTLKEVATEVVPVNFHVGSRELAFEIRQLIDPTINFQADELWSYVGCKAHEKWLWYASVAAIRVVLSFVFGPRQDTVF